MSGWIGVDLDATLAFYPNGKYDMAYIGPPVEPMCDRVRKWLEDGREVRVMTARAGLKAEDPALWQRFWSNWSSWSMDEFGVVLPVTDRKDFSMLELWDDRAVSVEPNTGEVLTRGREDD